MTTSSQLDALHGAFRLVSGLYVELARLSESHEETIAALASALDRPSDRRSALLLLLMLDRSYTGELAGAVVNASLSHRDAALAREVIARLPNDERSKVVAPHIDRVLAVADDDSYRRMAELLDHLGMTQQLIRLCRIASGSPDADIREVGEDFGSRYPSWPTSGGFRFRIEVGSEGDTDSGQPIYPLGSISTKINKID